MRKLIFILALCGSTALLLAEGNGLTDAEKNTFFLDNIQPVLERSCYKCHSAQSEKLKGGLHVDSRAALLQGGDTGPAIVPGHPEKSLLFKAVRYLDEDLQMPPKERLTDREIANFESWIKMGAPDPRAPSTAAPEAEKAKAFSDLDRQHWAFQKVSRPAPPKAQDSSWVRTPIDAFILAELEKNRIAPSAPADKVTLLRRACLDLIGLPPSPEEVRQFVNDTSPDAFDKVVDRLLASPHYGERWARHWLDLARFAESEGFKADETRPNIWRYRDYVIKSFNQDKPYDRFLREQIAGDELWPDDPEARIATGFNRHYPDESNARNLMQRRQEILNDIADTVGLVFTGLTFGCARCHDHKFDPILQKDYYRLQAFFANTAADDNLPLVSKKELAAYHAKLRAWEEKTKDIREKMLAIEEKERRSLIKDYVDKYPEEIQVALQKPAAERTPFECQMVAKAMLYLDPKSHQYLADTKTVVNKLKRPERDQWEELNNELKKFASEHPGELPIASGIADLGGNAPKTHLLARGAYDAKKEEIEPGFLSILDPAPLSIEPLQHANSTGRRAALANLLASPENPLTARVMANRIWQYHFGRGIVATPSDFGLKGEPPTHPALLDWLASEFVRAGWSMKAMHRLIMTSSVYQQSSRHNPQAAAVDPANKLFWKFPRQRLEGEIIRDAALATAGLLNPRMHGPSVFPELPPGMSVRGGWKVESDEAERNRRSIYVFVRRNTRYPLFESFDMPDTHESCARRNTTTSPLQALHLFNSESSLNWARGFAARVLEAGPPDPQAQIERAFELAFSRPPAPAEKSSLQEFLLRQTAVIDERLQSGEEVLLPLKMSQSVNKAQGAALVDLCHVLLNSNEFIYRN